jgi:hypothetical protein
MSLEAQPGAVVFQGEDKDLDFAIRDKDGNPFNLNNASEIMVLFRNADNSVLIKTFTGKQVTPTNAGGGLIRVRVDGADSRLLRLGDQQSVEIRVTINSLLSIAPALNQLTVLASLFPEVI